MADEGYSPTQFVLPERWVFLAPYPGPPDPVELCRTLHRSPVDLDGRRWETVIAFTDQPAAEGYAERIGNAGTDLKPLAWPTWGDLAIALAHLAALGDECVYFDPRSTVGPGVAIDPRRLFPIDYLIKLIAGRKR